MHTQQQQDPIAITSLQLIHEDRSMASNKLNHTHGVK